ncbi:hypothetical protein RhiirA4_482672 [Rhizophagus irregularis]|uniref:Helitron helicase-like domain-containing protein n=1 Tax=Rhizophagus irregularis TaxID=588596 RepID=A0A2I1HLD6_9GLOM|nr:hypothetical protein RhiirA4_482672 [Rhizophagus irregularis]
MNNETPKERQKRLQRERQQQKRQSDKENMVPPQHCGAKMWLGREILDGAPLEEMIHVHITGAAGVYTFHIHRAMYYRIGTLLPDPETQPQFAQIYISIIPIMKYKIDQLSLQNFNKCCMIYFSSGWKFAKILDLKLVITNNRTNDTRHYNIPSASEVARWHPNIPKHDDKSIHIHDENMSEASGEDEENDKCITAMNYIAYRLQVSHPGKALTLHWYGRLFQQWIVDMYAMIEQTHLNYLRHNQKQIQAELYSGLQDAINSGDNLDNELYYHQLLLVDLDKCTSCTRMEWLL